MFPLFLKERRDTLSLHKCNKITRTLAALIMIVIMTFSVTATSYENAYAAIGETIVIGETVIAVETAIAWLLAAFGLYATSALVYENRDNLILWGQNRIIDFQVFCEETYDKATIAAEDASVWLQKLARGTLDKASEVYQAFKAWCESLIGGKKRDVIYGQYDLSMGKITRNAQLIKNADYTDGKGLSVENGKFVGFEHTASYYIYGMNTYILTTLPAQAGKAVSIMHNPNAAKDKYDISYGVCSLKDFDILDSKYDLTFNDDVVTKNIIKPYAITIGDYTVYSYSKDSYNTTIDGNLKTLRGDWITSINDCHISSYSTYDVGKKDILLALTYLDYLGLLDKNSFKEESEVTANDKTQEIFDRDGTLDNYDLVAPVTDADTNTDIITIPWDHIGTYDEDGVLDISDVLDQPIADVTGDIVLPVDRVNDTTIADDVPITDIITDTSEMKDYTVKGLESVFPFCIPFDFINFINCLSAEPTAPKFVWHMDFLENMGFDSYTIEIDLSSFNSAAKIMRIMELLAFIIGLIMATRSMFIRG